MWAFQKMWRWYGTPSIRHSMQNLEPSWSVATVENQKLRPTATVHVVDYVAAKNQSVATALGVPPVLPEKVSVFKSDGSSVYSAVTWEEYDPQQLKTAGTFALQGTTELGELPVSVLRPCDRRLHFQ